MDRVLERDVVADDHHLHLEAAGRAASAGRVRSSVDRRCSSSREQALTPPVTATMAASTASTLGEAKISPQTAAVSIPSPTKPACAGSWPEPPPEITATWRIGVGPDDDLDGRNPSSRASLPPESATVASISPRHDGRPIVDEMLHAPHGKEKDRWRNDRHNVLAGPDRLRRGRTASRTPRRERIAGRIGDTLLLLLEHEKVITRSDGREERERDRQPEERAEKASSSSRPGAAGT